MTIDEQKAFQEKIFNDRFKIIDVSNHVLLQLLKNPTDFDAISKIATVRYHFYAELQDAFDRQMIAAAAAQEQNAYVVNTQGGHA